MRNKEGDLVPTPTPATETEGSPVVSRVVEHPRALDKQLSDLLICLVVSRLCPQGSKGQTPTELYPTCSSSTPQPSETSGNYRDCVESRFLLDREIPTGRVGSRGRYR